MLPQRFRRTKGKPICTRCNSSLGKMTCRCGGPFPTDTACESLQQNARERSPPESCFENASALSEQDDFTTCLDLPELFNQDKGLFSSADGGSSKPLSSLEKENRPSKRVCHSYSHNAHSFSNRKSKMGCFCTSNGGGAIESQSGERKGGSLQCSVCADLGGAFMCHECGSRGNGFEQFYRTSYLYKALNFGLKGLGIFGKLFTAGSRVRRYCSPITVETPSATAAAAGGIHSAGAPSGWCRDAPSSLNLRGSSMCLQRHLRSISGTEEVSAHERQQPMPEDRKNWQAAAHLSPKTTHSIHLKQQKDHSYVGNSFWASVNFLEETVVTIACQHPVMVWALWSLLSLGFFCGLNCILWPLLALLFLLRQLRILAWETAVRRLSPFVFSADLEALIVNHKSEEGNSTQVSELRKALNATEILSLMESQEKLFFSMPWMAVTSFAYCESLTLPELCTAITQNLLQPTEEFLSRFHRSADSGSLEHLPLSAFLHPRLLTRVERVLKRFCWVRQQNFHVSQQVMKFTKKGIDLLRQQRQKTYLNLEGTHLTGETGGISAEVEGFCACTSVDECDCLIDESDLIFLVNEALSQPLNPQKPLWQFLLLENALFPSSVANDSGKRVGSAVIFRMHHSIGDGISITRMFLKDFLRTTPAVVSTGDKLGIYSQILTEGKSVHPCAKSSADTEGVSLHLSTSRDSADGFEEADCSVSTSTSGSTLSYASTSTTWAPSEASMKTSNDGNDAVDKTPDRSNAELVLPSATEGVSLLKPSVSVCKIPEGIFRRVLVAVRFALQLPFYAATNSLLLRCEVMDPSRSGSARRTRISRPICIPLKHMKELKERLIFALTERSARQTNAQENRKLQSLSSRLSAPVGTEPRQHLLQQSPPQVEVLKSKDRTFTAADRHSHGSDYKGSTVNSFRITLNDVFAACIVGGYHRYAELAKSGLVNGHQGVDGKKDGPESCCWREDINFIVPVNVRPREEDAKDLRNRFVSLVIPMPFTAKAESLERLRGVHIAMRRTLHSFALPMVMLLERWLYATWPDLLMVYFLRLTRKISVIFSSVIGPASLPYVQNSRIHGMNFVVPQPGEVGVGVSAFSCGENVSLCVAADETVVKDAGILRECIVAEYKSLCRVCTDFEPMML